MRTIPIIILTLLSSITFGQQRTIEKDLLEIIKTALDSNRLPTELINNTDSLYSFRAVAIEPTVENKLKEYKTLKWGKVELWIWGLSYMFEGAVYWLTPSKIKIKDTRASFNFSTSTWGDKNVKYYKGTVKALKKDGHWTITKTRVMESKNSFDPRRYYKEQKEKEGLK